MKKFLYSTSAAVLFGIALLPAVGSGLAATRALADAPACIATDGTGSGGFTVTSGCNPVGVTAPDGTLQPPTLAGS